MDSILLYGAVGLFAAVLVLAYLLVRETRKATGFRNRLGAIPDLDVEAARIESVIATQRRELDGLRESYRNKRGVFERLQKEMAIYDDRLSFAELGVYEPHFEFQDSDEFKRVIANIRSDQKQMVKNKDAVICRTPWRVDGSLSKGKTMINRQIRLTLRAFNNECEAAIANTRWNNVNAMEKRIGNARDQVDKMNASQDVRIVQKYVDLKLKELFLTHEYREAQKREKDERAEVARLAREEKKLIRDAERAAEEEERFRELLEQARAEVASDGAEDAVELARRISELEADLATAHLASERARSMAEMTRSGYVYIISNIGSFGEEMVKIGLTRRLDPEDRIRELGDASVPFKFDTHAMIYSDDAPALEAALHREFDDLRVNAANYRKEFFRVGLDAVEAAVGRLAPEATFFTDREAQEYHETLARRRVEAEALSQQSARDFPMDL